MSFEQEIKIDSREEKKMLFRKNAEEVLEDQYNGFEINDITSDFNDEDAEKWLNKLSSLSERIDTNESKLSPEEIVVMKAKFIGEMTMYASLGEDRRDAKQWRERE